MISISIAKIVTALLKSMLDCVTQRLVYQYIVVGSGGFITVVSIVMLLVTFLYIRVYSDTVTGFPVCLYS